MRGRGRWALIEVGNRTLSRLVQAVGTARIRAGGRHSVGGIHTDSA